jgi:hypothetical protein
VLYRAPVELWDRSMQHLTILVDPGRLKRGVGPNRELGPPLKVGDEYALVAGSGLVDLSGEPLIHYSCAPHAGRTGFSFERKHWCRRQARRKSANDPTAPSALADPGLVLVRGPDRPDLWDERKVGS